MRTSHSIRGFLAMAAVTAGVSWAGMSGADAASVPCQTGVPALVYSSGVVVYPCLGLSWPDDLDDGRVGPWLPTTATTTQITPTLPDGRPLQPATVQTGPAALQGTPGIQYAPGVQGGVPGGPAVQGGPQGGIGVQGNPGGEEYHGGDQGEEGYGGEGEEHGPEQSENGYGGGHGEGGYNGPDRGENGPGGDQDGPRGGYHGPDRDENGYGPAEDRGPDQDGGGRGGYHGGENADGYHGDQGDGPRGGNGDHQNRMKSDFPSGPATTGPSDVPGAGLDAAATPSLMPIAPQTPALTTPPPAQQAPAVPGGNATSPAPGATAENASPAPGSVRPEVVTGADAAPPAGAAQQAPGDLPAGAAGQEGVDSGIVRPVETGAGTVGARLAVPRLVARPGEDGANSVGTELRLPPLGKVLNTG
ncbi:hypothetical protein [Sphaerisporangium corydalis]|uniref:Uncharacterized protein n=1 Tax=Sphaerisporangium corydalis TaxID=1441875 RepID=A0ABV9EIQ2_9ACTN|nr:hypothetical protein [Sphaerisporangium corydalis]